MRETKAFLNMMSSHNNGLCQALKVMAGYLGIPYLEGRENERVLRKRHEGKWVDKEGGGSWYDTGVDYAEENYPDSRHTVESALRVMTRPVFMWYHNRSMNLVIEDSTGRRFGVASNKLSVPLVGLNKEAFSTLVKGLRAKLEEGLN